MNYKFYLLLILACNLFGMPANPNSVLFTQPDNTSFYGYIKGDEWQHWKETINGYTFIQNEKKEWVYVKYIENNIYFPTRVLVNDKDDADILLHIKKHIKPKKLAHLSMENPPNLSSLSRENFYIPMLLIQYPDLMANNTVEDFEDMMNSENYESSQGITGSFYDYFQEVSYGEFSPVTYVSGWYTSAEGFLVYGDSAPDGWNKVREMIRDAVNESCDDGMDWSIYDNDGNGTVDALNIVHAGLGAEEGGNTQFVWSHSWSLGDYQTQCSGVTINNYVIQPERTNVAGGGMVHIGVFAHEFGHALGIPDLYDTDYSSSGIGNWGLMSGGSWGGDGGSPWYPVHMSAWPKCVLGWVNPIVIDDPVITIDIENVEENPIVFRMNGLDNNSEYFLFENRQKILYDQNLPHQGLLIWHIDESMWSNANEDHRLVDLEQADGFYHLNNNGNSGDPGDPYPGFWDNSSFAYDTEPNSIFYNGNPSGISVVNIEQSGSNITASFRNIPTLSINNIDVIEISGDNDSVMNPGEDGNISIELFNPSDTPIFNLMGIPSSNNEYIEVDTYEITFPYLGEFDYVISNEIIEISISPDIPLGKHSIDLYIIGELSDGIFEQTIEVEFDINIFQSGFPIEIDNEVVSSPIFVNSESENTGIIFGDKDGLIYMYDIYGNQLWDNPFDTGNDIWGAPAVADIDLDDQLEIVVASKSKQIFILDLNGNLELSYETNQFLTATPSLGNLDDDDELEIIIGSMSNSGKVYAINHDGTAVPGFPVEINEKIWVGSALFDMDQNGYSEIIVATDMGNLYLIDNNGIIHDVVITDNNIRSAPSIGIFNDGTFPIVFFGNDNGAFIAKKIIINDQTGEMNFEDHILINTESVIRSSPSMIEYSGNTYIFFTTENNFIYAVDINGYNLPGWPLNTNVEIKSSCTFSDVNNDGIPEVIISSKAGDIFLYTLNGISINYFPMNLDGSIENTPLAADIDNDGDIEIITGDSKGITIIDIKEDGIITPWNIHRGNALRNGLFIASETVICSDPLIGNLNCDEAINIVDIILLINIILDENIPSGLAFSLGDLNNDNILDIFDIILLVNNILDS